MRRQWQTRKTQPFRKPDDSPPAPQRLLTRMTSRDEDRTKVVCYMCAIDWQCEIGHARDGNRVYPSVAALKEAHPMWEECGIVEVEVTVLGTIAPPQH